MSPAPRPTHRDRWCYWRSVPCGASLRAGDIFYEPAGVVISKFDNAVDDVVFFGYFLLAQGEAPEIVLTSQD